MMLALCEGGWPTLADVFSDHKGEHDKWQEERKVGDLEDCGKETRHREISTPETQAEGLQIQGQPGLSGDTPI